MNLSLLILLHQQNPFLPHHLRILSRLATTTPLVVICIPFNSRIHMLLLSTTIYNKQVLYQQSTKYQYYYHQYCMHRVLQLVSILLVVHTSQQYAYSQYNAYQQQYAAALLIGVHSTYSSDRDFKVTNRMKDTYYQSFRNDMYNIPPICPPCSLPPKQAAPPYWQYIESSTV